jgi:small subunit ribosomal protein S17
MPRKKKDEVEETVAETTETAAQDEAAVEASPADETPVEAKPEGEEQTSASESIVDAAASALETAAVAIGKGAAKIVSAVTSPDGTSKPKTGKRAEKVGVVSSDKMTKTVVVNVDRLVKHPTYRKYVKRRKKFMAHDELGAKIGDKVKIIETRPLSARKRWRVVEIIQKAEL